MQFSPIRMCEKKMKLGIKKNDSTILPSVLIQNMIFLPNDISFYNIPINFISLDNVDFTECDPMLRITTLWFSESISPLSETDDVVHNVFLNTQCIRYCDVIYIAPNTLSVSKWNLKILLLDINASFCCI